MFARSMVLELAKKMNLELSSASTVSKAWEDNVGTQNLQRADIFTKGLTRFKFEDKRKLVMGW